MSESEAYKIFRQLVNQTSEQKVKKVKPFLQTWHKHWVEQGTVRSLPHTGRQVKITEEVAMQLSIVFKEGMTGRTDPTEEHPDGMEYHRFFTSVEDAMKHSPQFQALVKEHDITPRQQKSLLQRMRAADTSLVRLLLDHKMPFTEEQRKARMAAAKELLQVPQSKLQAVVWVDCSSIWITPVALNRLVWCNVFDERVHRVSDVRNMKPNTKIKLSFIVAVSGRHGPIWLEFLTGTTGLKRSELFKKVTGQEGHNKVNQ